MFLIPPNTPHKAVAIGGPVVVLDVFSPVREDYAELVNRYIPTS
jgi:quercetin dioxygenase-like cupin family protein